MGSLPVNDLRKGSQRPTLLREPPDADDWRLSDIAVDWARDVGGYALDPWQEWLVRWTFARRSDRLWAARDVGVEVARQNGKNIWLEVVELVSVCEFGDLLVTHSAHRADVSHEHFVSLKRHIEANDDLMDLMPTRPNHGFVTSHGLESIEFATGARILFKARANSSGRGPRPQKIVFDEALVLNGTQVGAMAPGLSAQKNAQVLYASSPPKADSTALHQMRKRALEPDPGDRLFYAAWNNPPDVDVLDPDSWYRVNPSLGYGRMTEDSLMANRKLLVAEEFLREHLGVPEEPFDVGGGVVATEVWTSLVDVQSKIAGQRSFALDVSPDRRWSCFAAAGRRSDGLVHVEVTGTPDLLDHRPGTDWVVARGVALWSKWKTPIRIEPGSPAGSFIGPLREAGVTVTEVSPVEHAQALGMLLDAVSGGQLRHRGQQAVSSALAGAVLRTSGDADRWGRRTSKVDITPLVAVTIALGGVPGPSKPARVAIVLG